MSNDVLKEYLIKLGYETDIASLDRFRNSIKDTDNRLVTAGKGVTALIAATAAATTAFAYSMRKMYFESEKAGSSVKNLKAIDYAAKEIGVSGQELIGVMKDLEASLTFDPTKKAILEILHVPVEGRDMADVVNDLTDALSNLPPLQQGYFAKLLGVDPQTLLQIKRHNTEFKEFQDEHRKIYEKFGVDLDAFKEIDKEYTHELDKIGVYVDAVTSKLMTKLLPAVKATSEGIIGTITSLEQFFLEGKGPIQDFYENSVFGDIGGYLFGKGSEQRIKNDVEGVVNKAGSYMKNIGKSLRAEDVMDFFIRKGYASEDAAAIAANLSAESGFKHTVKGDKNKKGVYEAYGLAQWHKDRRDDFEKVFGKKMQDATAEEQLEFVDWELKHTEYNAYDKLRSTIGAGPKGAALAKYYERPKEESEYGKRAGIAAKYHRLIESRLGDRSSNGVTINQTTNINVQGSDAQETAKHVESKQNRVNANLVRNTKGVLQ